MKISYLIFVGFLVILLMFSAATFINFRQAEQVNEHSEFVVRSTTIIRQSNRLQRNAVNMISGLRGYLFTGESYFMQTYDSAAHENTEILAELLAILPDSTTQYEDIAAINKMTEEWRSTFADPLIAAKKLSTVSDSARHAFADLYQKKMKEGEEEVFNRRVQQRLRDFNNIEFELRDTRKAVLIAAVEKTRKISFVLTTLSIVVGLAIAVFLAYLISTRILKMVKLANDIAAGNYEAKIVEVGNDELSKLATSLNEMATVLSENFSLLQRKNEELGQFAHIVSHDLKAPLRGIDNVVTWIQEDHYDELTPKVREYLDLIKGRLIRAENLIQGILWYARIGRELPDKESVDLNQLLFEIVDTLVPETSLEIRVQSDLPAIVTERIPLQQILSNLIGNAIKYHDKPDGLVEVSMKENHDHFIFQVKDNGPGIHKVYHEKIFQIFQTLTERDSFESTGVGLAIVKKILDDRKQTITLTSSPGHGATFMFTWPKF